MVWNELTEEEKSVIEDKGTERAYSGEYDDFYEDGLYLCRRCDNSLFTSATKFDAGCGWPAFDDHFPGAVKQIPDKDGSRTEIQCAKCGGHLGHVFTGEHLTEKNVRHCVNSLSLKFVKTGTAMSELATLAGGCFWCTEAIFRRLRGVIKVTPGYSGGGTENPTYSEVCTGSTGHAEVIQIKYDPTEIDYQTILKVFMATHDPTTINRQGNDVGTQYRSAIFYHDEAQKELAMEAVKKVPGAVTEIVRYSQFYEAEVDHQQYYELNQGAGYCTYVIAPKIAKLLDSYGELVKPKYQN